MINDCETVARNRFLDVEQFMKFCREHGKKYGVFDEHGALRVSNFTVDELIKAAEKAGVRRLSSAEIKKQFREDIYVSQSKPDRLVIATSSGDKQRASGKDFISTAKPKIPHPSSSETRAGITLYSAYLYRHSKTVNEILMSLKGKGPYEADDSSLEKFLADTAGWAGHALVKRVDPNLIVYPKSSSELTKRFVEHFKRQFPEADLITDAFAKNVIYISGDDKQDRAMVGTLIDVDHPKFETLSAETVDALEKRLLALIKREGTGVIPIKKVYKPLAKFVKGFIKAEPHLKENLKGARVLVVDDILSSGTTMREMARIVRDRGADAISGFTIFRQTSSPAE